MKQPNATKSQAAWFPYSRAWLKALSLLLLFVGIVAILRILIYWGLPVAWILSKLQHEPTPIIAFLFTVYFVIPIILISSIHYILFGKSSPRWLPKLKSLWIGFYSWIAINLSTLVSFGLVIPFTYRSKFSPYQLGYFPLTDTEVSWFIAIWIITAAYLCHAEYLLKRWLVTNFRKAYKPSVSSQPKRKNLIIDDVGVELDNLRAQMGLHKMKGKDKPKPKKQ